MSKSKRTILKYATAVRSWQRTCTELSSVERTGHPDRFRRSVKHSNPMWLMLTRIHIANDEVKIILPNYVILAGLPGIAGDSCSIII